MLNVHALLVLRVKDAGNLIDSVTLIAHDVVRPFPFLSQLCFPALLDGLYSQINQVSNDKVGKRDVFNLHSFSVSVGPIKCKKSVILHSASKLLEVHMTSKAMATLTYVHILVLKRRTTLQGLRLTQLIAARNKKKIKTSDILLSIISICHLMK